MVKKRSGTPTKPARSPGQQQAQMVAVLAAAAYAEAGQFNKATAATQQAIELARATGNQQLAAASEQFLRLYTSGRPYHELPANAANQQ